MRRFLDKYKIRLSVTLIFAVAFGLLYFWKGIEMKQSEDEAAMQVPETIKYDTALQDTLGLYKEEDRFKVYEVYLTVYTGLDSKSGDEFNLTSLNQITGSTFDPELKVNAFVKDPDTGEIVAGIKTRASTEQLNYADKAPGISNRNLIKLTCRNKRCCFRDNKS